MIVVYILLGILAVFLLYICFLAICSLFVDPKKEYTKNSRFYRVLLNSASAAALKFLRIRVHTSGLEKIPQDQKMLFVGNHRSNFDPIIQWVVLKHWDIAFLSKAENFEIPFFGRFIRKCCFLAIDREDPRKALTTIHKATDLLQSGEVSIGVMSIQGTEQIHKNVLRRHSDIYLDIVQVISADEVKSGTTHTLGEAVRASLLKNLDKGAN